MFRYFFNKIPRITFLRKCVFIGIIFFMLLNVSFLKSQDPVFTQFHQSPLHLNPAFAGNSYAPIVNLNTRIQWPSINFAYKTYFFSVDKFFKENNFGAGLDIVMDDSGNGIYKRFKIEVVGAYRLQIQENNFFKMGLSAAYGNNSLDWDKLIFGDMIDPSFGYRLPDGSSLPTSEIRPDKLTVNYIDLSAGLLYYSEVFYIGIGIKHANTPKNYYFSNQDNVNSGLPVRFAAQIGGEFDLAYENVYKKIFLSPSLLFVSQGGSKQLTFNSYINFGPVFAGIGFRYDFYNPDATLFSVGLTKEMFKIAYSFDYTVSKLGISSGGSHEIGISINFENSTLYKKPYRYSDCFEMYR
ncbi:MAG TPA: type IX secretion system membrane protein PorP/SprF [Bacteroidetes bacterium]|nr:type IX secretion system membrane protein PorP/SprF [Bacteroidota bacterium]